MSSYRNYRPHNDYQPRAQRDYVAARKAARKRRLAQRQQEAAAKASSEQQSQAEPEHVQTYAPPKTTLRTSQNVYYKLTFDNGKDYDTNEIVVGYHHSVQGDCEIAFASFHPNDDRHHVSFDNITYYRTEQKMLWDKHARIDLLFNSGDTKAKLRRDASAADISFANHANLPLFVQQLLHFHQTNQQINDLLLGLQLKMTSLLIQNDIPMVSQLNNESARTDVDEEESEQEPRADVVGRYTHFLSIRITNPLITDLATTLQKEIVEEYKQHSVNISSSLVQANKFHITMNVLQLNTQPEIDTMTKLITLLQAWLQTFIFCDNDDETATDACLVGDDGVFLRCIQKHQYDWKLKSIYEKIKGFDKLRLYLEGANHFNQAVIFLDFENQCLTPSDKRMDDKTEENNKCKWKPSKQQSESLRERVRETRNQVILQWIQTLYNLISHLCRAYNLTVNDTPFIPHATIMKLSKLKSFAMRKLIRCNKKNKIFLQSSFNHLGDQKRKRQGKQHRVYDFRVLSATLNDRNISKKVQAARKYTHDDMDDEKEIALFEHVKQIDFCSMLGSHLTEDKYYPIIQSLAIVPP